jgi:hypothetical protein
VLLANDATFGEAVVWLIACIVAWFGLRRLINPWALTHPRLAIATVAAVARAVPAFFLDRGLFFDIEAHWWIGSLTLIGQDVYSAPLAQGRYPYPPLHMYLSALMVWLSDQDRMRFLLADKLIPAAFGVALAVVIYVTARRLNLSREKALVLGLLYALNPLPMMVTSYHGQFEEIPLLFIALAFMLLTGERRSWGVVILSALSLGIGVAYKTWPLLFLPPLVLMTPGIVRRALYVPLTLVPIAASIGFYGLIFGSVGRHEAISRIVDYKGSNGFCWGYVSALHSCWVHPERLRPNIWVLSLNSKLLVGALAIVCLVLLWRRRPLEGMVALPLTFYLFSPGWGPNYSIWVLPFAILLSARLATVYTVLMLPAVSLIYFDSLYAAYGYTDFSWNVLKPLEGALGLLTWGGIIVLLGWLYLGRHRDRTVAVRSHISVDDSFVLHPLGAAAPD